MVPVEFHLDPDWPRKFAEGLKRHLASRGVAIMAQVVADDIRDRDARGVDAHEQPFPVFAKELDNGAGPYSRSQGRRRRAQGLQTGFKDIRETGELARSITFVPLSEAGGGEVTPTGSRNQLIMAGQMFHPKWAKHHDIMYANDADVEKGEKLIAADIEKVFYE